MQNLPTNPDTWVEIGTGISFCAFQHSGDCRVYLGASAPSDGTDVGFYFNSRHGMHNVRDIDLAGGGAWIKSVDNEGAVTFVTSTPAAPQTGQFSSAFGPDFA